MFQSTHPQGVRPSASLFAPRAAKFQSTHPQGVRLIADALSLAKECVSIHAPARGATTFTKEWDKIREFQSTHPQGVRLFNMAKALCRWMFQSTHPQGVRQYIILNGMIVICFNPRTRKGCDLVCLSLCRFILVSIHAPARGATCQISNSPYASSVSIHAPARGATWLSRALSSLARLFQSTHPQGVRLMVHHPERHFTGVSIHAPARGATLKWFGSLSVWLFQSTHPQGVRRKNSGHNHAPKGFQSTHPQGVRRRYRHMHNPRLYVSIHAPARGATRSVRILALAVKFQSTHPQGVRPFIALSSPRRYSFQSTHPQGVRRSETYNCASNIIVSIHAPARGATQRDLQLC